MSILPEGVRPAHRRRALLLAAAAMAALLILPSGTPSGRAQHASAPAAALRPAIAAPAAPEGDQALAQVAATPYVICPGGGGPCP